VIGLIVVGLGALGLVAIKRR
jgi:hypothetical protein